MATKKNYYICFLPAPFIPQKINCPIVRLSDPLAKVTSLHGKDATFARGKHCKRIEVIES